MKLNARELELQALRVRRYEAAQALKRELDAKDAAAAAQDAAAKSPAPAAKPAKKAAAKSRRSRASSKIGRSRDLARSRNRGPNAVAVRARSPVDGS
ncbi:hypothetical protein J4G48_0015395 [Bradyrhizobium barranii subsp. apii]|uniref:hypothetical protein n=1 Tax=Bradyrhizobium barranii TaxID=2992140 RepID=UPI001AA115B1|nr:hypothetical protein [Bradyrhizobium barranii]UPT99348.1 hypothetical protein J4G48_0015395 [Bradyrhizobium barranii subsp. apii]